MNRFLLYSRRSRVRRKIDGCSGADVNVAEGNKALRVIAVRSFQPAERPQAKRRFHSGIGNQERAGGKTDHRAIAVLVVGKLILIVGWIALCFGNWETRLPIIGYFRRRRLHDAETAVHSDNISYLALSHIIRTA